MCVGGGPLGSMISFFAYPVKNVYRFFSLFFGNCVTVGYASFGEKGKRKRKKKKKN